jgi:hypothetical protein
MFFGVFDDLFLFVFATSQALKSETSFQREKFFSKLYNLRLFSLARSRKDITFDIFDFT